MSKQNSITLARSLSLRHVVLLGLAFMGPQTVFSTYGVAVQGSQGMLPTGYAIALVVMIFTAYSYGKLVQAFPRSGAAYTFAQKAISPHVGFLVGWTILLDYLFSPMISTLLTGIMLAAYFPSVPMYVWILLFLIGIATVNILGIKLAANFNGYMLLVQATVFLLFFILSINKISQGEGAGTFLSSLPFYDPNGDFSLVLGIVPLLCFSYLGFDAITTLSEETKQPHKTIPRAIFLITGSCGILFVITAYLLQLVYPNFNDFQNPDAAYIELAYYVGGAFFEALIVAGGLTTAFASASVSCASGARILYAMGREGALPQSVFGFLSAKYHTPVFSILIICCIGLGSLFLDLVTAASFINFGALFAFTFVNLSVIGHYYMKKKQRSFTGTILYLLLPLIGAFFTGLFWTQLDGYALILGGSWLTVGIVYFLYLTRMFRLPPPQLHLEESAAQPDTEPSAINLRGDY